MPHPIEIFDYDPRWTETFIQLRDRLQQLLGPQAESIEHVGSTAVPGLAAKPIIDVDVVIGARRHLAEVIDRLAAVGYAHQGDLGIPGREAFATPPGWPAHHLYVCEARSQPIVEHLAFRDYLRSHPDAADEYGALKRSLAQAFGDDRQRYTLAKTQFVQDILRRAQAGIGEQDRTPGQPPDGAATHAPATSPPNSPAGGIKLSPAEIEALDTRWSSCWTPNDVAQRLVGIATPWYVAGGWAVDLFRGTETRKHGDIEIAVPAAHFPEVRSRLAGYAFDAIGDGRIWENATDDILAATYQTWLRDPATGNYLLDVFREQHDSDNWICRRDESIRLPYRDIIRHTQGGIPYLTPELVLLFKAKHARPKDQADFDETVPYMTQTQRQTLSALLARVHPGHRWLAGL